MANRKKKNKTKGRGEVEPLPWELVPVQLWISLQETQAALDQ